MRPAVRFGFVRGQVNDFVFFDQKRIVFTQELFHIFDYSIILVVPGKKKIYNIPMPPGFSAGICPNCNEHLLLKQGLAFLVCPLCAKNITAREAQADLERVYTDPAKLNDNIAKIIKLEKKYGPQLPYQILLVVKSKFPHNEEVAFLALKMSDFNRLLLKEYLSNFARFKKAVSFANEVLEHGMTPRNYELLPLFEQYIDNKTKGANHTRWIERLREMNASVEANPPRDTAHLLIYSFYIGSVVINIALAVLFAVLSLSFYIYIVIALVALCAEMVVLYSHARKYANRLTIPDGERALMVIFMCSIVVLAGGVFLGTFLFR